MVVIMLGVIESTRKKIEKRDIRTDKSRVNSISSTVYAWNTQLLSTKFVFKIFFFFSEKNIVLPFMHFVAAVGQVFFSFSFFSPRFYNSRNIRS